MSYGYNLCGAFRIIPFKNNKVSDFFVSYCYCVIICVYLWLNEIGRLPRPDIVHFRSACRGTEIFLRELTLLNTLSSNPKSSRSVDLAFSYKLLFYLH